MCGEDPNGTCARKQAETAALFQLPSSGSFPFQISWDDVKRVAISVLYVAAAAVVTYLLNTVLPGVHTDNPMIVVLVTVITGVLQMVDAYLRDTRPAAEKMRLPYKAYKLQMKALKMQAKN